MCICMIFGVTEKRAWLVLVAEIVSLVMMTTRSHAWAHVKTTAGVNGPHEELIAW